MKTLYPLIALSLLIFSLSACKKSSDSSSSGSQTQKLISGDFWFNSGLNTLCPTSDNGFAVATLYGGHRIYVAKTNSSFDVLWTKMFSFPITSSIGGMVESSDKGFVIVTSSYDTTSFPVKYYVDLIKLDQSGDSTWSHTYTGHSIISGYGMDVQLTPDNGYTALADKIILKTDSAGNQQWEAVTDANDVTNIRALPDGSYVVLGTDVIWPADTDQKHEYALMKYDASGNKLWEKVYPGVHNEWSANLCLTPEGGFIFSGTTEINTDIDVIDIIKTDGNGNKLASKTIYLGRIAEPRGLVWQNGSYVYYGGTTLTNGIDYYLVFLRFNL